MLTSPLLLSLIIVAAAFTAGVIPFAFTWTHTTAHRWIAFGAGTILSAAFVHMLPEGYEVAGPGTFTAAVLGFLALYAIEQFSFGHPHDESEGEFHEIGFLAFLGLFVHDLVDGLALGSGPYVPELTPAIFTALILHKIPTTFSLSILLLHGEYPKKKILLMLTVMLMAIPAGTMLSTLISSLSAHRDIAVGWMIGFSAGTFIYIGAYELLPEMQRTSGKDRRIGVFFLAGISVMFLLKFVHPVV